MMASSFVFCYGVFFVIEVVSGRLNGHCGINLMAPRHLQLTG